MTDGVVKTSFLGDPAGLLAAMQKIEDKVDKQKDKLEELADASSKAGNALAKHLGLSNDEMEKLDGRTKKTTGSLREKHSVVDSLVGSTLKWAAATLSVHTALQLVNQAQERQKEIADKSVDAAEREAKFRQELARNLKGDKAEIENADKRIVAVQNEFGIADKGFVTQAFTAAQSELPNDIKGQDELVRSAAKFSDRDPAAMKPTIEGLGNLKRAFPKMKAAEREGFFANVMEQSPIADISSEARHVLPSAELLKQNVDLDKVFEQDAAAEHIAYQHQMMRLIGDKTGETSGEAMVRLTNKLNTIFTADEQIKKHDPGNTRGRMEFLQKTGQGGKLDEWSNQLKDELMGRGLGEAKARQATKGLVTGDYDELIDKEIGALKFDPQASKDLDAWRKGDPFMQIAQDKGRSEAKKHQEELQRAKIQGQKSLADTEFKRFRDAYTAEHPIAGDATEAIDDWTLGWAAGGTPEGQMNNMRRKINSTLEGERAAQKMYGPDKERDNLIKTADDVLKKIGGYIDTVKEAQKEAQEATKEAQEATKEAQAATRDLAMAGERHRRQFRA